MLKIFPNKNQWKGWTLPSKLGAIGTYLAVLLAPLAIWSFFTPNTIIYNVYNDAHNDIYNEKAVDKKDTKEKNKIEISKTIEPTTYSIIGYNNPKLIKEIERKQKIKIDNKSSNKISFSNNGEIFAYGDASNNIFKSRKGRLTISVNDCISVCEELIIPSLGPAPKSIIEQEINKEIGKVVNQNIILISEKINKCIN
ncbi:hypothetical protein [Bizionia sp.]|uniref:hypothetical protein n=1 Tax=Bizionia sp. TaxID=1954480 RepID=UPI003A93B814